MCGIAGIINFNEKPVESADLKLMTDAIRHRGPDGEGVFIYQNIGFGHRRLAIIDLSDAGAQPMTRFGCTITYNGEIYNYIELRQELENKGIAFTTKTDTEVILAAYHVWGKDCVQRFNGMWSFAIHDSEEQQVFFSRDRFGEKPFYYYHTTTAFIFCSEIKGILAKLPSRKANIDAVLQFLVFEKSEFKAQTFFDGIKKLPAAHSALLNLLSGNIDTWQYFTISQEPKSGLSEKNTVSSFREKFEQSVRWRLRSDVPVGTCLSGGLDSSNIAAVAAPLYQQQASKPMTAITAASIESFNNEAAFAAIVSNQFGLSNHVCTPGSQDFQEALKRIVWHQEEPFHSPSVAMQYFVMQSARQAGICVLLDGQGADEILMGYPLHLGIMLRQSAWMASMRLGTKAIHHFELSAKTIALLWGYHSHPMRKAWWQMRQWKNWLQKDVWDKVGVDWALQMDGAIQAGASAYQVYDMFDGNLPMLLRYEDKNAMAFSVETRLPYLDHTLAEWCIGLPYSSKMNEGWSKWILRQAMSGQVNDAIVWRKKKIGFEAPAARWMADNEQFNHVVQESRLLKQVWSGSGYPSHPEKWWRLVSLAMWEKAFQIAV